MTAARLLELDELMVVFGRKGWFNRQQIRAVNGVSFSIDKGETFGLVGESGCGKTTTGRAILRLTEAAAGTMRFAGTDVPLDRSAVPLAYRRAVQVVFQDPYSSLNPRLTINSAIDEAIARHLRLDKRARAERISELLAAVGLPQYFKERFPRELSGGQRQRVAIARALAVEPELIVLDEPVSSLDVSTQSQVINLLEDLQQKAGLSFLFISHDLTVVRHISQRVGIMYRGRIVEEGDAETVYRSPLHPYTQLLLASVLVPDPARQHVRKAARRQQAASVTSAGGASQGCAFRDRCPLAMPRCASEPPRRLRPDGRHMVECHHYA